MELIKSEIQITRALTILNKAFHKSPGIVWMLGETKNDKKLNILLSVFLHEASINNGAYLTSDNNGVVLFFQIQNQKSSFFLAIKKIYVLFFVTGFNRGLKALKYKKAVSEIRPKTGWLGWLVATDNSVAGNAAAYEIKNFMFGKSDESNETIFVETTVPRVRILYKMAGYSEYAHLKHPYNNTDVWFMKRDPKTK